MDDRLNIILSPHLDDAVLSLGGFIATAPERAIVVTIFAGTPDADAAGSWDRWSRFKTTAEAMRARTAENEAALSLLGVPPERIVNLAFPDRQYRQDDAAPAGLQAAIAETVRDLAAHQSGPATVFSPASGWHPDHRAVTDAVIALWKSRALGGAEVLLYQDQPYAYLELRQRSLVPLRFATFPAMENRHGLAAHPEWLEFDATRAEKKRQAADRYKSQFPVIRPLLCKMIADFARFQARAAGLSARYAEKAYRLSAPEAPHS